MPELGEAGRLYVFGGQDYTTGNLLNDLHYLDLSTKAWSVVEPGAGTPPTPRTSHSCAHLAGKLVIFGGSDNGELKLDLLVFDLETSTWSTPELAKPVAAREMHACCVSGDKMYVIGGRGAEDLLGDVCVFDAATLQWGEADAIGGISERCACGAAAVDGKIYVFGGTNGVAVNNEVEVLDTATGAWLEEKQPKKQPCGRFAHTVVSVGENVVVFGGITFEEDLSDVCVLTVLRTGS